MTDGSQAKPLGPAESGGSAFGHSVMLILLAALSGACPLLQVASAGEPLISAAELRASILSADTREPLACTVTIVDANGRTMTDGEGLRGAFRSSGVFRKLLPPGPTRIRVTRGPEFKAVDREIELRAGETNLIEMELERQVDLRRRGWFAGDSHVHMMHGEKTVAVDFDQMALAARAEDLQYLSVGHAWALENPTPERLEAELDRRSTPDCVLTWNLEAPKNYFKGDAGRCLGHCWTLGMRGRTPGGADVITLLLQASAGDYESHKLSIANFESHALIHAQDGAVFYTHPARWWTGPWGGEGGYPKQDKMRVSNMAVELPLDVLAGPTFDGLDIITGGGEFAANEKSFQLWSLLLNHGYRLAATGSSDACFDRPGDAQPGAARLYTFIEGGFTVAAAARAAAQGRTFVTTGPLLVVSVDRQPPGTSFPADGRPHELRIEAWASGAVTGGLAKVEILRNGQLFHQQALDSRPIVFQTNQPIAESGTSWYCVRLLGANQQRQRAISGAFFFDEKPWHPPEPIKAKIRVRVMEASSGRMLDATVTEVNHLGTEPQLGATHRLPEGSGVLTIPATTRLRATAAGFEPVILSPLFDNPALVQTVTRLEDKDLLDWRTFERVQSLLEDLTLTFTLTPTSPTPNPNG
jgi:hypothetical protein